MAPGRRHLPRILAGIILGCLFVPQVSGYRFKSSPQWKLASWNKAPGFKARITQNGLNFLKDVGLQLLQKEIEQITIPDQHGKADVKIGHIYYDITQMHVTSFGIPTSSLTPSPTIGGLTLTTSGVYLNLHGNWHYETHGFIHISDSGSFDASASSISLTVNLRIGVDKDGRPTISAQGSDCSFHVGNMDIKLHGGASWLYNLFDSNIADSIKDSLNDQVCKTIINEVNTNLADELKTLKVIAPIDNVAEIDYSLVSSPTFNGSINTAHKGEVYPLGNKTECPLPIPVIPSDSDTSRMVFLWITDFLPNSAGYVLQNVGFLQYNVTPENIPDEYKGYLNTSNFAYKFLIPKLSQIYPNMAMEIHVNSTTPPVVRVKPDQITAVLEGYFSPYAVLPNKTLAYLFTLNITITTNVSVSFQGNNITWKISTLSTNMKLVKSTVGTFSTSLLEAALNSAINVYFIPDLNEYGAIGVPLPQLEGFNFTKPVIKQGPGFIKIGTDLNYTPSRSHKI